MMPVAAPHITIDGQPIAESWAPGQAVALDGLSITFGNDSLFEVCDPARLKLEIIDPDGTWSATPQLINSEVIITRDLVDGNGNVRLFRGHIRNVKARPATVTDDTGTAHDVWRATITAYDPLSLLDSDHTPGPAGWDTMVDLRWAIGYADWAISHIVERAVALGALSGVEALSSNRIFMPYEADDLPSLLEVLNDVYSTDGFVCAVYDAPSNKAIHTKWPEWLDSAIGRWALTYTDGVITFTSTQSLSTRVVLAADQLEVPDGITINSDTTYRIGQVAASHWVFFDRTENGKTRAHPKEMINIYTIPGGSTASQLKLDARWQLPNDDVGGSDPINEAWVGRFNGRLNHPVIRIRPDRNPSYWSEARLATVLRARPSTTEAYFFAGSMLSQFPGGGPTWAIRGGTLTYEQGWALDLQPIPWADLTVTAITIDDICKAPAPTYANFDPDLCWVDFNQISQGVPA